MTRETLEWLAWLIQQQTIALSAPDAREQCAAAFRAMDEIAVVQGATPTVTPDQPTDAPPIG